MTSLRSIFIHSKLVCRRKYAAVSLLFYRVEPFMAGTIITIRPRSEVRSSSRAGLFRSFSVFFGLSKKNRSRPRPSESYDRAQWLHYDKEFTIALCQRVGCPALPLFGINVEQGINVDQGWKVKCSCCSEGSGQEVSTEHHLLHCRFRGHATIRHHNNCMMTLAQCARSGCYDIVHGGAL